MLKQMLGFVYYCYIASVFEYHFSYDGKLLYTHYRLYLFIHGFVICILNCHSILFYF